MYIFEDPVSEEFKPHVKVIETFNNLSKKMIRFYFKLVCGMNNRGPERIELRRLRLVELSSDMCKKIQVKK